MWSILSRGSRASRLKAGLTSASRPSMLIKAMPPAAARKSSTLPPGYVEDKSKGPMMRFNDSLPKLPVPSLQETAARYIKTLEPLLTPEELERSKAAVQEFTAPGAIGEELQKRLVAKMQDPSVKNWMIDWWNFSAYLGYRDPVVPYVSYFYSHIDDKKRKEPVKRAAAVTTAALSFKKMVDEGTLEPEYMRKAPIDMDSYKYMFNCCRIPEKPADYPKKYPYTENKHIIVIRKNNFYKVVHEVDGKQLSTAELEAQLKRVLELATERGPAIGALSSENRDIWTDTRKLLIDVSSENLKSLETIESASFVVCLDEGSPVTLEERAKQFWLGDGQNRFYDKPCQFVINENGTSGFLGEHSMMDGTPTHRLNDYVNEVVFKNKIDHGSPTVRSDLPEPVPVKFSINKEIEDAMTTAIKDFKEVTGQHELKVQRYQGYGKRLIKKFKCSPDAYVQMIIQLAYYKMYGKNRPTYESAATRKFQLGRTETCRSVSNESVAFCKAMQDPNVDSKTCAALLHAAVAAHVKYISDASEGHGVDRHFFGLRNLLSTFPPNTPTPSIFTDPAFKYSSSWFLSTSQLSSEYFNGYGWSQVIDQGFGIAYMINENTINFNIVCKGLGAERMAFWLGQAADDMREVMESEMAGEPAKAKL